MSFLILKQKKKMLCEYLSRRRQNCQEQVDDFFVKKKTQNEKKCNVRKRFNTTPAEVCQIDFRIKTFYKPSNDYKFTGDFLKTKYRNRRSVKLVQIKLNQIQNQEQQQQLQSQGPDYLNTFYIQKYKGQQPYLSKSQVFQPQRRLSTLFEAKANKFSIKYQIKHPTPVKQAQFLVNLKTKFLKRHGLNRKGKSRQQNDLIKIQDYLTQKKESFRRKMQSQLVRVGQGRLLSQIKQRKGKIYLGGLHNIKKKRKQVQNIDQLLLKSRQSFSTTNTLINHLKLKSQIKQKLQNIRQLNQQKMQNCLEKIKSINLKRETV